MVSRAVNLLPYWKTEFEKFGYKNIHITNLEKDGLNSVINDIMPSLMLIGSCFYKRATPYMMGELLKHYPELNIAVVNIHEFPDELAMCFILKGVKSYVNMYDGMEEFHQGLSPVRDGKIYVSPAVRKRIIMRRTYPMAADTITDREQEVMRLICCGFKDVEIADTLHISRRTVDTHKTKIFRSLNVRNSIELIQVALYLGIVQLDEIGFFPNDFVVNPKPQKMAHSRKQASKKQ